jgi:long-chain fatty acid transport protein
MAFIDHNIAQFTIDYARIKIKYKGNANDYQATPSPAFR